MGWYPGMLRYRAIYGAEKSKSAPSKFQTPPSHHRAAVACANRHHQSAVRRLSIFWNRRCVCTADKMQAHQGGQVIDTHTTNPICMSCFFASKRSIEFMSPGWTISYSLRSFVIGTRLVHISCINRDNYCTPLSSLPWPLGRKSVLGTWMETSQSGDLGPFVITFNEEFRLTNKFSSTPQT